MASAPTAPLQVFHLTSFTQTLKRAINADGKLELGSNGGGSAGAASSHTAPAAHAGGAHSVNVVV